MMQVAPPMKPLYELSRIVPRKPQDPETNVYLAQRVVRSLPYSLPGLIAAEVTYICAVAPAGVAQGSERIRHFVRTGVLYTPNPNTNGTPSSDGRIHQLLLQSRADIEQALSVAYEVHPAAHGDVRLALGCDLSELTFMVGNFANIPQNLNWPGPVWFQPVQDELLKLPGRSALGMRIVKEYASASYSLSARYYPVVMTLGLDAGSPAIAKLIAEVVGSGIVVINKPAPSNRPTFAMVPVTSASQRDQIIDLYAHLPMNAQRLFQSPAMTGDMAAHLLGLPQRLFEE